MRIYTEPAILRAKCYDDIFSSDDAEAKKQFRHYCKSYHPDADSSAKAQKIFSKLMELYRKKPFSSSANATSYSKVFRAAETGKGFELGNYTTIDAGSYTAYHTKKKVAMSFPRDFKKFYDAYISNVGRIQYADKNMENQFSPLFPKIIRKFEDEDGNNIILLDKTEEVLNLALIMDAYEKAGKTFPHAHAAWIVNRLYNIAVYINFYGWVFNGFSATGLWVSPEFHTILPYGGWEYMTGIGEKMIGCPKDVYKLLPKNARDKHLSETLTDLESIKFIGRKLFENSPCKNVLKLLDSGSVSDDVLHEWEKYENAVMKDFGERKFVVWEDVPYAN